MNRLIQLLRSQPNLTLVTGALVALLALATGGYVWLTWRRPAQSLAKIGSRIRFLWVMAAMCLLAIAYSYKILLIYIAFLAFLGLKEYLSITPTRRVDRRVLFWAYLSIPIQFALIWFGSYRAFLLFMPVYVFLLLPMRMVIGGETRGFLRAWSMLGWGLLSIVFSLGCLAYLLVLPANEATAAGGLGMFLYLMMLVQLNHVTQFYFGKRFAYPKLSLKVSATRNWASLAGSLLIIPAAWLAAPLLTPFTTIQSIVVGLFVAAGGFVGHIVLSAVKGDLQLKGWGAMAPGRDGVLNRIDAIVYTAPLYFFMVSYLYY
jgi:phosphatidate cytidylyltransferase